MKATTAIGLFLLLIFILLGAYQASQFIVNFTYYSIYLPLKHLYDTLNSDIHSITHPFGLFLLSITPAFIGASGYQVNFSMLGFTDSISEVIGIISYSLLVVVIYLILINAVRQLKSKNLQRHFLIITMFVLGALLIYISQIILGVFMILFAILFLILNLKVHRGQRDAKE